MIWAPVWVASSPFLKALKASSLCPERPSDVLSLINHHHGHYVAVLFESNSSYVGREVPCLVPSGLTTWRDSVGWGVDPWATGEACWWLCHSANPWLLEGGVPGEERAAGWGTRPVLGVGARRGPADPRSFLTLSALLSRLLRYILNSQLFATSKLL